MQAQSIKLISLEIDSNQFIMCCFTQYFYRPIIIGKKGIHCSNWETRCTINSDCTYPHTIKGSQRDCNRYIDFFIGVCICNGLNLTEWLWFAPRNRPILHPDRRSVANHLGQVLQPGNIFYHKVLQIR